MEETLWDLFRETGDPMGYLLYRAEAKLKKQRKSAVERKPVQPPKGVPPASV